MTSVTRGIHGDVGSIKFSDKVQGMWSNADRKHPVGTGTKHHHSVAGSHRKYLHDRQRGITAGQFVATTGENKDGE